MCRHSGSLTEGGRSGRAQGGGAEAGAGRGGTCAGDRCGPRAGIGATVALTGRSGMTRAWSGGWLLTLPGYERRARQAGDSVLPWANSAYSCPGLMTRRLKG